MNRKTGYLLFVLLQVVILSRASSWQDMFEPMDVQSYQEDSDPYFSAVCTAKDRCVTTCNTQFQDGCICYNDGTCVEEAVNRCRQCTDPNVFAVFEGERCPRRHPFVCSERRQRFSFHGRHHRNRGLKKYCGEKVKSCVCDSDGNCKIKKLDICKECEKDNDYLAIFVNSTCPDSSLSAECMANDGNNPSPTTCNFPDAYSCQDEDRESKKCKQVSAPQGCVCYEDGTCVSQPVSACACQRPDVISVYSGEFCPTNCTAFATEEGEGEGEGSEGSEGEEGESKKTEESEESSENSKPEPQQPEPVTNFAPLFNSSEAFKFFECNLNGAYQCLDIDRNQTNCSKFGVESCICNNQGSCVSVFTNKCDACLDNSVATILEGAPCNCTRNNDTSTPPQQSNVDVLPVPPQPNAGVLPVPPQPNAGGLPPPPQPNDGVNPIPPQPNVTNITNITNVTPPADASNSTNTSTPSA